MKRSWICFLLLLIFSCDKVENYTLPYRQVYLEIDLTFKDQDLLNLFSSKIYTSYKGLPVGLGGVLVFHGLDSGNGEYQAYDTACPYESAATVTVSVDGLYAVCPICKSRYDLSSYGYPSGESISKKKLQSYRTESRKTSTSEILIVIN